MKPADDRPLRAVREHGKPEKTEATAIDADGAHVTATAKTERSESERWARVDALATAAQALVAAGLASQARPLVDELVAIAREARGPTGRLVSMAERRAR